jgi:hypothetical protein
MSFFLHAGHELRNGKQVSLEQPAARQSKPIAERVYKSKEIEETATAIRTYCKPAIDPITKEKSSTSFITIGKPEVKQTDLSITTLFGENRFDYVNKCVATDKGKPFWTPKEREILYRGFCSKIKRGVKIPMTSVDKFIISLKITYPIFIQSLSDKVIRRSIYNCVNYMSKKKITCSGPFPEPPDTGPLAVKQLLYSETTKMYYPLVAE